MPWMGVNPLSTNPLGRARRKAARLLDQQEEDGGEKPFEEHPQEDQPPFTAMLPE